MKVINKVEQPDAKFDLYFLGYDSPSALYHGKAFNAREGLIEVRPSSPYHLLSCPASLNNPPFCTSDADSFQLTHNYGTENDPDYAVVNGNTEPHRGFGHTCISVDNIQAACQRIEDAGYKFQKKLSDGRMRHIAFALDPDNYWVELIGQKEITESEGVKETDVSTYRMVSISSLSSHPVVIFSTKTKSIKQARTAIREPY